MEMILFAERIAAEEAFRVGLVNRLVPEGEVLDFSQAWAAKLCENGPLAIRAMKQAAYEGGFGMNMRDGLRLEAQLYEEIMKTEDAKEGPRAFTEKRPAKFAGR